MSPDITTTWRGTATPADQRRIEAAIHRGIQRGIATARSRHRPVPSAPRPTPIATAANRHHDELYVGPQLPVRVVSTDLNLAYRTADSGTRVETDSVVRALHWGSLLFGANGFVVRQEPDRPGRFSALPLTSPLSLADVGGWDEEITDLDVPKDVTFHSTRRPVDFIADTGVVLAVTREGNRLFRQLRRRYRDDLSGESIVRQDLETRQSGDVVSQSELLDFATDLLSTAKTAPLDRLLSFDGRTLAAMSLDERSSWLAVLIDAANQWFGGPDVGQLHRGILRLVRTCASRDELEALFAPVGPAAVATLFARFDSATFELLLVLGELVGPEPVDVDYLKAAVLEQRDEPLSSDDAEESLTAVLDWVVNFAGSLRELPKLPATLAEAAPQLYRLYEMVAHATGVDPLTQFPVEIRKGDQEALLELVRQLGRTLRTALSGARYAERLGMARGAVGGVSVGRKIVRRLKYLLLLEVATSVIGVGELKAVAGEARRGTRWAIELLVRLRGAKAVLGTAEVARAERLLAALGGVVGVADAEHAARLVKLLPPSLDVDLELLITNAPARATSFGPFRTMAGNTAAADRLRHALEVAKLVEQKAGGSANLTEEVVAGLRKVLETADGKVYWLARDRQLAWFRRIQDKDLPAVMKFVTHWTAAELEELFTAVNVIDYATSPAVSTFLGHAGPATLRDVMNLFERKPQRLIPLLERFGRAAEGITDPVAYLNFVERLRQGDAEVLLTVAGQGSTEVARALDRLRSGGAKWRQVQEQLTITLRETDVGFKVFDVQAAFLNRLSERELDGLERLVALDLAERGRAAQVKAAGIAGDKLERAKWILESDDQITRLRFWSDADRKGLTGLIGDLLAHASGKGERQVPIDGLDRVVSQLLRDDPQPWAANTAQGAWGQLLAARDLIRRDGALALRFEVAREGRRIDIKALLKGLDGVEVEVKTNLAGGASMIADQVRSDLRHHATTYGNFSRLLYRYHEQSKPLLGHVATFFRVQLEEVLTAMPPRRRPELRRQLDLWLRNDGIDFYKTD